MSFATGLAHSDAPEHKRIRGLLAQAFTPVPALVVGRLLASANRDETIFENPDNFEAILHYL